MSKTYLDQVCKAKVLTAGLKGNYEQAQNIGISLEELSKLENAICEGEKLNGEVDRLRSETQRAVLRANQKLSEIKVLAIALKRTVKRNIDVKRWSDFGVLDKR